MRVDLLTNFDFLKVMEYNAAYAMLICHANTDRLQEERAENFIKKAISMHHDSILEHITLTYAVYGLSRACLQELSRHRHISLSVESTRHTLREKMKNFDTNSNWDIPGNVDIFDTPYRCPSCNTKLYNVSSYMALIKDYLTEYDYSNDEVKYLLPEFWPTNLVLTANVRELRHIISLRTAPAALKEFQDLAREFVNVLPERFKYLLEDCVYVDKK